jgi:hypothetical protein
MAGSASLHETENSHDSAKALQMAVRLAAMPASRKNQAIHVKL